MERVMLTGVTGFIGRHVARALLQRGYEVRALLRPGQALPFSHPSLTAAQGDVRDRGSLDVAMAGCDSAVHSAAAYTLWAREPNILYNVNVDGTRNVLQAAVSAGVKRIVYTSTDSTIKPRPGGVSTEEDVAAPEDLIGHYKRSKWEAERVALRMARDGVPVVIVNPTAPVGPEDVKPTPTGKVVLDFLNRQMPAVVETGLNLVDVRDVAEGHCLALAHGRPGERYLLGNIEGNLTLAQILQKLSRITGLSAPRWRLPHMPVIVAAYIDTFVEGNLLRRPPRVPIEAARLARKKMWTDPSRAVHELGLPQRPIEDALRDSVDWFASNGYVRRRNLKPTHQEHVDA